MTYARRTDANLTAIALAYKALGCSVDVTNAKWDLTVGYGGIAELVEVKDGAKSASRRKLTPAQVVFRKTWTGGIRLITCLSDVEIHVAGIRRRHAWICQMSLRADPQT